MKPKMTFAYYLSNLFGSLDQTGNAICAGDKDVTISARTGYNAAHNPRSKFWKIQERIIDFTFKPLDGEGHCKQAWEADKYEHFYDAGWSRIPMTVVVLVGCLVIGILLRVLKPFY